MIVCDNYSVICFESTGDLEFLKDLELVYYSMYDGFVYFDSYGNMIPYNSSRTAKELDNYKTTLMEGSYSGQYKGTDGTINDPNGFVKSKYGKEYSPYSTRLLKPYEYIKQYDLSIYLKNKRSEGNCTLSSIYSLMNYLKIIGKYKRFPSSSETVLYNATKDSFYTKYKNDKQYVIVKNKELPKLYFSIRQNAVKKHGYEVGGTNPFVITNIITDVGKEYGYNINAQHIIIWTFESQVVSEINAGYPTIWNMANSSTYNSHSTVVTGYRIYRKTTNILGINFYNYVKLLALNDNWYGSTLYFDFTNYYAFGSFVKVR